MLIESTFSRNVLGGKRAQSPTSFFQQARAMIKDAVAIRKWSFEGQDFRESPKLSLTKDSHRYANVSA